MIWVLVVVCALAAVPSGLRWLRVAQREHYLAGSTTRFANRWYKYGSRVGDRWLWLVALFGVSLSTGHLVWSATEMEPPFGPHWPAIFGAAAVAVWPVGLSVKGRTSPLAWTPRLKRVAGVTGALFAGLLIVALVFDIALVALSAIVLLYLLIDVALWLLAPLERRLGNKWVDKARRKLEAVSPKVVAITGSYGKTTTKGYVTHLLSGSRRVLPTPASFNNRMGLARTINELLTQDTEVFVAEMGTYGKGEIADMCSWVRPDVAAIVSIGPVHLERFKTEERIVAAKSEIFNRAAVGVLAVDNPHLATLARKRGAEMEIIEVGTGERGRVLVSDGLASLDGVLIGPVPDGVFESNLAVAIGLCVALGIDPGEIAGRLADLPRAEHRLTEVVSSEGGFTIIDDTFNSNPEGARRALAALKDTGAGRKVLVTPGMVELGKIQYEENERFAAEAALIVDLIVIVGNINRAALHRGSANGSATVTVVPRREEAVAWVRSNLGPGDAVLYENDLPDHYP